MRHQTNLNFHQELAHFTSFQENSGIIVVHANTTVNAVINEICTSVLMFEICNNDLPLIKFINH